MVIRLDSQRSRRRCHASLLVEMLVAMSILVSVLIPLAWSIASERRLALALYQKAVAMEIVDGEMERLQAGAWREYTPGQHPYAITAKAAKNLPPGKFLLTLQPPSIRLEWRPAVTRHGGPVVRETKAQ